MWIRRIFYFNALLTATLAVTVFFGRTGSPESIEGLLLLVAGALLLVAMWTALIGRVGDLYLLRLVSRYLGWGYLAAGIFFQVSYALKNSGLNSVFVGVFGLITLVFLYAFDELAGRSQSASSIHADWRESIREEAGQQERNRLSQELHDSVKQQLFAIQANLATAEMQWEGGATRARQAVQYARTSAKEAMVEMNALIDQLQSSPVGQLGLIAALRQQCDALTYRTSANVECTLDNNAERALSSEAQTALFRIAQEAFSNIARHARAHHVQVKLHPGEQDGSWELAVVDDGQGFDQSVPSVGMGLESMNARARRFDGYAVVNSGPGLGCNLKAVIHDIEPLTPVPSRHGWGIVTNLIAAVLVPMIWKFMWAPGMIVTLCFYLACAIYNAVQFLRLRNA